MFSDEEKKELREKLALIENVFDFEFILSGAMVRFPGSMHRCADELVVLTPADKKPIALSAIERLSRYPNWNYAGD